jgi:hypothetical protein
MKTIPDFGLFYKVAVLLQSTILRNIMSGCQVILGKPIQSLFTMLHASVDRMMPNDDNNSKPV